MTPHSLLFFVCLFVPYLHFGWNYLPLKNILLPWKMSPPISPAICKGVVESFSIRNKRAHQLIFCPTSNVWFKDLQLDRLRFLTICFPIFSPWEVNLNFSRTQLLILKLSVWTTSADGPQILSSEVVRNLICIKLWLWI